VKLKTQSALLIAGIAAIPIMTVVLISSIWINQKDIETLVPQYREVKPLIGEFVNQRDWESISRFVSRMPPSISLIVMNADHVVLYSTIEGFRTADKFDIGSYQKVVDGWTGEYIVQFDRADRFLSNMLVITRIKHADAPPDRMAAFNVVLRTFAVLCTVILVFALVVAISLTRSITRSVLILEQATARVASGELDFPIEVRGSNEITSLTYSLNSLRLALKEEKARQARFIMSISHDLKTPLALIVGYVEALTDDMASKPEDRQRYLEIIQSKEAQLDGMIDDLVEYSRLGTGEWQLRLKPVPFCQFLKTFAARVEADAFLLGRSLEIDIDVSAQALVSLDERLALRALENLVNNALRYIPLGGRVALRAHESPDGYTLCVEDDGPGIDPDDLGRIFEPFFRATNSRREQGFGLGLSIVKNIADSHGWSVSVFSEPGRGTRFEIRIPGKAFGGKT
jgi:signal transduction histidine kinase